MVADTDAELREAQQKFLEERAVRARCQAAPEPSRWTPPSPPRASPPNEQCPNHATRTLAAHPYPLLRSQKMKTAYETDIESNYNSAEEVEDKKNIYVTIVGGLVVVAFVAPMLQYFYYTGGE